MKRALYGRVVVWVCGGILVWCTKLSAQATNVFPGSGNVGIGTTSPSQSLEVNGTVQIDAGTSLLAPNNFGAYTGSGSYYFRKGTSSSFTELFFIGNNGNVGIGTSTPSATLTALTGGTSLNEPSMVISKDFTGGGDNVMTAAIIGTDSGIANTGMYFTQKGTGGIGNPGNFVWEAVANGSPIMMQNYNGSVGIGTTSPGATLEVNGSVKLTSGSGSSITFADGTVQSTAYSGTCTATGGDYAESVDVIGEKSGYEPGDVMVLTSDSKFDVAKSSEPYSTMVAGIYSTKPGYVGRRQRTNPKLSNTEIPMAMVGIVPTKVTAENGAIHRGDLLVTASKPGYAMKGTDRNRMMGAVVGKAMGSLDSGTSVIEVLVSLQ